MWSSILETVWLGSDDNASLNEFVWKPILLSNNLWV